MRRQKNPLPIATELIHRSFFNENGGNKNPNTTTMRESTSATYDTGDPYTAEKRRVWHDLMKDSSAEKFGAPPQSTTYDIVPIVECPSCHRRAIIDKLTGTTSHSAGCDAV